MSFNEILLKAFYLYLIKRCFNLLHWIYKITLRKRLNLIDRYGKGSWALVTGATDGIGKGFIMSLAKIGFNIILVSRNLEKLKKCEDEIHSQYPSIKTVSVKFDFSKEVTTEAYTNVFNNVLSKYDVSLLVNNVGTGESEAFLDLPLENVYNTAVINTLPQAMLTRMFAEKQLLRDGRSGIINLSSIAAIKPIVYFTLYSATKVFNEYLSKGLEEEMKSKIDFLCVKPFGVESNLSKMRKCLIVISAEECAEGSLDCLGHDSETTSHWNHDIQTYFYSFIPVRVIAAIDFRRIFKLMFKLASRKNE